MAQKRKGALFEGELSFASEKGGAAIWSGKLFEAGDYPDKGVEITDDDIAAIAANSGDVPLKIEHTDTVLDKALTGFGVVKLWAKGSELFGQVRVPAWLEEVLGDGPKKVSVGLSADLSRLVELSLVKNPRVSSAAIFSAYAEFAGQRHSRGDLADMQRIHDIAVSQGAGVKGAAMGSRKGANMSKSLISKIKTAIFGALDEVADTLEDGEGTPQFKTVTKTDEPSPELIAAREELQRLRGERETRDLGRIDEAALAFAKESVKNGKALPADEPKLAARFKRAVLDDNAGKTCFSDSGALIEGDRVKDLREDFKARPSFNLTEEQLKTEIESGKLQVVFAGTVPEKDKAPVIDTNEIYANRAKAVTGGA